MKINQINNSNFTSKQKYISQSGRQKSIELTKKMIGDAVINEHSDTFTANVVSSIKTKQGSFKPNQKYFLENPADNGLIEMNFNNRKIVFDNTTGEIKTLKKPLFRSAQSVLASLEHFMDSLISNYNNESVVTKNTTKYSGFTQSCNKNLMGITDQLYIESEPND